MEEMVPELEDMVKQQYFSKQEVKQIVKRRQDFEYLLKRKAALKEDYFRCVSRHLCTYRLGVNSRRRQQQPGIHPTASTASAACSCQ
jgi:hypothetical protein